MKSSLMVAHFALVVGFAVTCLGQGQRAETLLSGLEAKRQMFPDCSFEMIATGSWGGIGERSEFFVQFEDGKFLYKKDRDHAAIFNEGETIYYNPGSCTIKNPSSTAVGFLFDPRVLGLATGYWPSVDLDMALRRNNAQTTELVGKENIGDRECWKVRIADNWGEVKFFWIDPTNRFQVLKCEHHVGGDIGTTLCKYDSDFDFVPSEVSTRRVSEAGRLQYDLNLEIRNVNLSPSVCTFDLSSLGMRVGTPVSDIRLKERIGFWNGTKLVSFISSSPQKESGTTRHSWSSYFIWPIVALGMIGFFAYAAKVKFRT